MMAEPKVRFVIALEIAERDIPARKTIIIAYARRKHPIKNTQQRNAKMEHAVRMHPQQSTFPSRVIICWPASFT
jgi:hypothetical protein